MNNTLKTPAVLTLKAQSKRAGGRYRKPFFDRKAPKGRFAPYIEIGMTLQLVRQTRIT
jgi:hypothetical protein